MMVQAQALRSAHCCRAQNKIDTNCLMIDITPDFLLNAAQLAQRPADVTVE